MDAKRIEMIKNNLEHAWGIDVSAQETFFATWIIQYRKDAGLLIDTFATLSARLADAKRLLSTIVECVSYALELGTEEAMRRELSDTRDAAEQWLKEDAP